MSGGAVGIEFYEHEASCCRCHATSWEQIGEFVPRNGKPQDVLECAFCGERIRVDAPFRRKPRSQPLVEAEEFRFQYGRFQGLTLAEADAEPNGRRYLEVMRDRNEKLKERITEYLTAHAAPSA